MNKCPLHDAWFQAIERQYQELEKKMDEKFEEFRQELRLMMEKMENWTTKSIITNTKMNGVADNIQWLKNEMEQTKKCVNNLKLKFAALSAGVSLLMSLLFIYFKVKGF